VFFFIAIAIFCTSGWPIFYLQKRMGKGGIPFVMWKFRTMCKDADTQKQTLLKQNETDGPVFKIYNDPRHTPIGRLLSHTGVDELPQLFNIVRGDMTFVGPRPFPVDEAVRIPMHIRHIRESVLPGILFPYIYEGYHEKSFLVWMENDLRYVQKKSLWGDVVITYYAFRHMIQIYLRGVLR